MFSCGKGGVPLEITEFSENSVSFGLPPNLATLPILVLISGTIEIKGKEAQFNFIGRAKVSQDEDAGRNAHLALSQYDKDLWQEYLKQRSARQERAEKIFKSIKGEDPV